MSCPDDEVIAAYVARRLDPAQREAVEAHAAECTPCAETLRVYVEMYVPTDEQATTIGIEGPRVEARVPAKLGRFVLLEEIGRGGMGRVYAAFDPELDRKVALKMLAAAPRPGDDSEARLRREAQAMARLVHPNVVTVLEVGVDDESPERALFLAMEFVDGPNLRKWLTQCERTTTEILDAFAAAGRGLAAAHDAGLVHRDFKPDNVLVDGSGHVRVTDFGLARAEVGEQIEPRQESGAWSENLTRDDVLLGTLPYMAPEQFDGSEVGPAADQFAWCTSLYEALYGKHPFPATPVFERATAIADGLPEPPAGARTVPESVLRVLERGLAAKPGDRWPSMHAALRALQGARRRPRVRRATGVVVVGLLAAAGVLTSSPDPTTASSCPDPREALVGVWDDALRSSIEARYRSEELGTRVIEALDQRAEQWTSAMDELCEAQTDRTRSTPELAVTGECLQQRRVELATFVEGLVDADASVLRAAAGATRDLPAIEACAKPARYLTESHGLVDPQWRPKINRVRETLAKARAMRILGRARNGHQLVTEALPEAREIPDASVVVEALLEHAQGARALASTEEAWASLREAARLATGVNNHALALEGLLKMMSWAGDEGDAETVRLLAEIAQGHLDALGGDDEQRRQLLLRQGYAERIAGNYDRAEAAWKEAATLSRRPFDELVDQLNVGMIASDRGHWGAANIVMQAWAELVPDVLGPQASLAAQANYNLALCRCGLGDLSGSLEALDRADMAYRNAFGDEHPQLLNVHLTAFACLLRAGNTSAAAEQLDAANALAEHVDLGPTDQAFLESARAVMAGYEKPVEEAITAVDRAIERTRTKFGDRSPKIAALEHDFGAALLMRGEATDAAVYLRRALDRYANSLGPRQPRTAAVRAELGVAYERMGDRSAARVALDQALGDLSDAHGHPWIRGDALRARARLHEEDQPDMASRDRQQADALPGRPTGSPVSEQ